MRARSPGSDYEEPSEEALLEAELKRLQRSYRILQNDYRSYKEDTRRRIRKQRLLINALEDERTELDTNLAKMTSSQNRIRDAKNTAALEELTTIQKQTTGDVSEERRKAEQLSKQISAMEQKVIEQRRSIGGYLGGQEKKIAMQKKIRVLENKLDRNVIKRLTAALQRNHSERERALFADKFQAVVHFDKQLTVNRKLRDEIDHLRIAKAVFDKLYNKLANKLESCKTEIREVIDTTTQAFEQRDEANNKMVALKERSEKDQHQHAIEMADLRRTIDHDEKIKEFMGIKNDDRLELKAEEAAKRNKYGDDHAANIDHETMKKYEDAFKMIKTVTGQEDIDIIVETFIKKEKENFALYNYVNELNFDVEKLQDDIGAMQKEIETCKQEDFDFESGHSTLITQLETKCEVVSREADQAESNLKRVNKILDELKSDVERMFKMLRCDPSPIKQMLGGEAGITNKTMMIYMGQIEQRATHLSNMLHYVNKKRNEMYGIPNIPRQDSMTKAALSFEYHAGIIAPSIWDRDDEDDEEDESYLRPLTEKELRVRVLRNLSRRAQEGTQLTPRMDGPSTKDRKDKKKKKQRMF